MDSVESTKVVIALPAGTEEVVIVTLVVSTVRICAGELIAVVNTLGWECFVVPLLGVEVGKLFICDVSPESKDSLG